MNPRIKRLAEQCYHRYSEHNINLEKFAELIVEDCANFVRESYNHPAAESLAWAMEINYGLHGDYA